MHVFIAEHQVNRSVRHVSVSVQMIRVDFDYDIALFDAFLSVLDLLALLLLVFS